MAISDQAKVHPSAIVEEGAEIAAGCVVGPFCYVDAQVVLHP
ncbi:MAG: acyl-[acyl-carrier-protein]--UDP-N-acetylglucosamine O-acyltransferase, partial [Rhodobacteraceae bacterium]|nr:acyl-[acyl-carrier-protein]--UDP-N-acetylglucosamine O-acyltransferase [Paracoccaceae bacterium]